MSPSTLWSLSLIATAVVAVSLAEYSQRPPHAVSLLERSPTDGADDQEISSDNPYKYDRISGVSSKNSDPDQLLLTLWNERTSRPWSNPLQLFGRPSDPQYQVSKREGHSLSIVNPLDVLRQRMMLEMARRRMKENQEQIKANDVILKTLGKRNGEDSDDCEDRRNYSARAQDILPEELDI